MRIDASTYFVDEDHALPVIDSKLIGCRDILPIEVDSCCFSERSLVVWHTIVVELMIQRASGRREMAARGIGECGRVGSDGLIWIEETTGKVDFRHVRRILGGDNA